MSGAETPRGRVSSRIARDREGLSFFGVRRPISADAVTSGIKHLSTSENPSTYIPPWTEPYIIGVAGNSGSGKTSVSQRIIQELNQPWTVLLSFDNFYKPLTPEQSAKAFNCEWDFDAPESMDIDMLVEKVESLKRGEKTEIPVYSFVKHNREERTTTVYGANVIILEGIYALYDERLRDLMDLKIFVDTDLDVCLSRRIMRDLVWRGRDFEGAMKQWETFVKPNAVRNVIPTINHADVVIPRGLDNTTAINLMIKHVQKQLAQKSMMHLQHLRELGLKSTFDLDALMKNKTVVLLPNNNHTRGIHSILFSRDTDRSDFIFYFDRISILLTETVIDHLTSYEPIVVPTSTGTYQGLRQTEEVIAVSVIRSGDCFMNSIKKTFPDISIGKLLIQLDSRTGEPQLHMEALPRNMTSIQKKKVVLFDAQVISGAAAIMAVQVLIDHKVKQSEIILCCYLCTEIGLRRIINVFPDIQVVIGKLSSLDDDGEPKWYNEEEFKDTFWPFRTRFIDSLYFGTK